MKHRLRFRSVLVATLLVGGCGLWVWQTKRQYALNRELIAAINHADAGKANALLQEGADANTIADEIGDDHSKSSTWWYVSSFLSLFVERKGNKALELAVENYYGGNYPHGYFGNVALVRLLVQHGANTNFKDNDGIPVLGFAAYHDHPEIVALLLKQNSVVNTQDSSGITPLLWAVISNDEQKVRLMLERRANPNIADTKGNTPLLEACSWNNTDMVKMLLNQGADIHAKNNVGQTVLMLAREQDNPQLVRLLQQAGAKKQPHD